MKKKDGVKLEDESRNLRQYLIENVIPILSRGLLEVCKKLPKDPVDELAMFLMENSGQVAFPNPSTY